MKELLPKIRVTPGKVDEQASKIRAGSHNLEQVEDKARRVIADVKEKGDQALVEYTRKFDGVDLVAGGLLVRKEEIREATLRADKKLLDSMKFSMNRLKSVQGGFLRKLNYSNSANGFKIGTIVRPLRSIGCYIPGGRAAYASSVLMTAGVAKAAGVKRVIICTPPNESGDANDAILAAAGLCGVSEVYKVGGAQAIAALAYGTETVPRVDKIVGPGGIYVAAAKKLVSADVQIDFFAGPTELVVVADESADPRTVAWEVVGQSEHGEDSICGFVTWSEALADEVREEVYKIVPNVGRKKFVDGCLQRGFAAVCKNRGDAVRFVNALAPEHLEVMVTKSGVFVESLQNCGLVLEGKYSPCAASDYCIGTDHVIPTEGFATFRGGLSALDFVKVVWRVEGSKEGVRMILPSLKSLAYAEGLTNHYLSVESRFKK